MGTVIEAIQFGIGLSFLIGPVFFSLIQTSTERGFFYGFLMALGISLSDAAYVAICYFGLIDLITQPENAPYLAWVGGLMLIGFGLYHSLVKGRNVAILQPQPEKKALRYVLKGFVLNGFNPSVLFFWIATISLVSIDFGYTAGSTFWIFFGTVLTTVFSMDLLKAYLAGKLSRLITPRFLKISNVVLGLVLIGFGIRLIWGSGV